MLAATAQQKCAIIAGWALCSFILFTVFKGVFARNRGGSGAAIEKADRDGSGRLVSLFHCVTVSVTSLATVITSGPLDFTDANGLEPALGCIGLCVSVGYFLYDFYVLIETNFHPLAPMIAHHILSGGCMALIALSVPRAAWYACLLQATEVTAPNNIFIFFLERRSGHKGMLLYSAARWLQLALWLVMRELLFVYFAYMVWRDWGSMPPIMKALGWGTGVPLFAFNTAGLFKVVLKGFPWRPTKESKD